MYICILLFLYIIIYILFILLLLFCPWGLNVMLQHKMVKSGTEKIEFFQWVIWTYVTSMILLLLHLLATSITTSTLLTTIATLVMTAWCGLIPPIYSGVHTSLHPNCKHQIVHSSFNLYIYYLPPYQRLIWDYKKADSS